MLAGNAQHGTVIHQADIYLISIPWAADALLDPAPRSRNALGVIVSSVVSVRRSALYRRGGGSVNIVDAGWLTLRKLLLACATSTWW